jgi:hypothetical protein
LERLHSFELGHLPSSELEHLPSSELERLHSFELGHLPSSELEYLPSSELERLHSSELEHLPSSELERLPSYKESENANLCTASQYATRTFKRILPLRICGQFKSNILFCVARYINAVLAACSSQPSANFYQTTRCYIPDHMNLHSHTTENYKSNGCMRTRRTNVNIGMLSIMSQNNSVG